MKQKYVYWQDDELWLGYLEAYPDYWMQGESEQELRTNLLDLYKDLSSREITRIRRVTELDVA